MCTCIVRSLPALVTWLKHLQQQLHSPPNYDKPKDQGIDVVVTVGAQDGLCKVSMLILVLVCWYLVTIYHALLAAHVHLRP